MTAEKSGEFRGKTVEAATSAGLAALRLTHDEVTVEIVRPGSRGVLGIGAEDAVVRITALATGKGETPASAKAEGEPASPGRPAAAPAARNEPRPEPKPAPKPAAQKAEPKAAAQTTAAQTTAAQTTAAQTTAAQIPAGQITAGQITALDKFSDKDQAAAQTGRDLLLGLVERMGLRATVEILQQSDAEADEDDERSLVLNIVGDDLGVLIGRQNETLSALEFITRLMTNQQTHSRTGFVVDVNGHRAKRAEALRKLALRMADQTVQTGRTMTMEPMPPAERRIIHLALRDHPSVTTQSVGEGDRRKVTIVPKKS
jgi:spoIIIJ-associated protein